MTKRPTHAEEVSKMVDQAQDLMTHVETLAKLLHVIAHTDYDVMEQTFSKDDLRYARTEIRAARDRISMANTLLGRPSTAPEGP